MLISLASYYQSEAAPPSYDADAQAYITAVETADGQTLETGVKDAINDFVVGCKADGIWTAIKASCILAGARTLNGALVPLVGTAPTNVNFVSGDYLRKTGLKGDGATKYLNTNRLDSADPRNDLHVSAYMTSIPSGTSYAHLSSGFINPRLTDLFTISDGRLAIRNRNAGSLTDANLIAAPAGLTTGFWGSSRASSAEYTIRYGGTTSTVTQSSNDAVGENFLVFARNGSPPSIHSAARISFYSIGTALTLASLDTRVSNLMTALDGAIV